MKSESPVKKHHFWILFGVVPLLTLIGVIVVNASVGSKIDENQAKIDKAKADIGGKTKLKPKQLLDKLDAMSSVVNKKQDDLHKENWDRQKVLFTWPRNSDVFKELERRGLPFGSDLPDLGAIFSEFQRAETYQHEYSTAVLQKNGTYSAGGTGMADLMAPTQFAGGDWRAVLRHVNDFGQVRITKEQVWLLLEDLWVQRSLLSGLRSVNLDMAKFEPVKADGQTKTKKVFRNRVWELALEVVPEGNEGRQRLTGTLTNISERLQLMGKTPESGNGMAVNVWLSADPSAQPMLFKIGGEFLPGRGAVKTIKDKDGASQVVPANVLPIVPVDDHILPAGTDPLRTEIVRVEQVFDVRTVPLKRIDALVLGHTAALDSRSVAQPGGLVPPLGKGNGGLFAEEFVKDPAAADPSAAGGPMGSPGGMGPAPGPGPGGRPGLVGDGGTGGTGSAATRAVGGGPLTAVIDGNKKRYLAVTPQVRRMPVGLVVVVDQAYLQDVLLALSNSPLRFQITQVAWTRFRGTLDGLGVNAGSGTGGAVDFSSGSGSFGSGFGPADPDAGPGRGGRFGPPPGAGVTGIPMGMGPVAPGPGGPGSGGPGYAGSGSSVVSDSQITSGLIELSVYGVVSLYELPKAPDAAAAPAPNTPVPNTPVPNTPIPNAPMPMAPNATPPKMRRRVRA